MKQAQLGKRIICLEQRPFFGWFSGHYTTIYDWDLPIWMKYPRKRCVINMNEFHVYFWDRFAVILPLNFTKSGKTLFQDVIKEESGS